MAVGDAFMFPGLIINTWQKCKTWLGVGSGTPGRKANTIITELKRILPEAVGHAKKKHAHFRNHICGSMSSANAVF